MSDVEENNFEGRVSTKPREPSLAAAPMLGVSRGQARSGGPDSWVRFPPPPRGTLPSPHPEASLSLFQGVGPRRGGAGGDGREFPSGRIVVGASCGGVSGDPEHRRGSRGRKCAGLLSGRGEAGAGLAGACVSLALYCSERPRLCRNRRRCVYKGESLEVEVFVVIGNIFTSDTQVNELKQKIAEEEQQGTLKIFKEGAYEKSYLNWRAVGSYWTLKEDCIFLVKVRVNVREEIEEFFPRMWKINQDKRRLMKSIKDQKIKIEWGKKLNRRLESRSQSKSPTGTPARVKSESRSGSRSPSRVSKHSESHSRSRSKSRSRSRRHSHRRYTRSRSHSHSHRRRSRSRSYTPEYRRRRSRSHSPMSNRRRHTGSRANPDPNTCLGVFGLSLYTTERDLREVFSRYGPLSGVNVVYDQRTGRSRGFAFVYFERIDDSKEAMERANGMELDGRRIRVDYSITKRAHTPTPGIYMGRPTQRRDSYYDRGYDRGYDRYEDYDYRYRRRSPSPYYSRYRSRSRSRSYSPRRY
ncbi:hypothetical protein E5288_WYG001357 [Bos mutus]|nr:hypothetical protein [Bos mutus]